VVAVVLTSLIVSVKSVITLWIVLVKSLARLCRALATPLNVLAALLTAELALPADGLAAAAVKECVIDDTLPSAGPIGRFPRAGVVDGTVRSSNRSRVRGGRHEVGRLNRRFWWRPFVQWRRSRIRIMHLLSKRANGFPVSYHVAFPRRPD
jgi:hypothetical protein